MPIETVLIVGAGGHAKVVFDALRAADRSIAISVRDDRAALEGVMFFDVPIRTPIEWTACGRTDFHVAIGENSIRERCFRSGCAAGARPRTIVHPAATVSVLAYLGAGTFVGAGAVVAPAARIGEGSIVNHGAVVDHDCMVGDFCHVAPTAALGGGVRVGERVLIGAGAIVLPGRTIGSGALIGAGAVVDRDVAAGITVVGVPARPFSS
jgi:sugar O-acyltransferase (sialic acid O-acetyltransferase NeuD family)